MKIENKTFLVTGGASGLGETTARHLLSCGANVIIADLNAEAGTQLASEFADNAVFSPCDVTSADDVQNAINTGVEKFGGLHGSVNCAGIVVVQKLVDRDGNPADLDQYAKGVQINLIGTFNVARLVATQLIKQSNEDEDKGVIVNVASIAAFDGQVGQASYSSSKAGVVGLGLPLARELSRHGIRVMTIAPGIFNTPMMASIPDEARESLAAAVPYPKRLGEPSEFASLVGHIIENAYLNAEVIRLDGAIRMA